MELLASAPKHGQEPHIGPSGKYQTWYMHDRLKRGRFKCNDQQLCLGGWPFSPLNRKKCLPPRPRGNDPASGHPRAHQPPLGRGTSPPAWDGRTWPTAKAFAFLCVDATQRSETGQVRGLHWHNRPREWEGKEWCEADGHGGLRRERPREGKGKGRGKVRARRKRKVKGW